MAENDKPKKETKETIVNKALKAQDIPQQVIKGGTANMVRYRQPLFTIVVGKKGIGKTYTTEKILKKYVQGNIKTGTKPRKVIILDINQEFTDYPTIPVEAAFDETKPNWILAFSSSKYKRFEIRRVIPIHADGRNMSITEVNIVLSHILENFYGGMLLVEDIAKYVADTPTRDLTGGLATIRHRNCDVICHFQWKSKALNPKLWGNINLIRVHNTTDSFEKYLSRIQGSEEILMLSEYLEVYMNEQRRLNATPDQIANENEVPIATFYCYADMDKGKIKGAFDKDDFKNAVHQYIIMNQRAALNRYLLDVDPETGKKKYTFTQAYELKMEEIMQKYYGN